MRRLFLLAAVLLLLLGTAGLALWLSLPRWLPAVLSERLLPSSVTLQSLDADAPGLNRWQIRSMVLALCDGSVAVQIHNAEISYQLHQLIGQDSAQSVTDRSASDANQASAPLPVHISIAKMHAILAANAIQACSPSPDPTTDLQTSPSTWLQTIHQRWREAPAIEVRALTAIWDARGITQAPAAQSAFNTSIEASSTLLLDSDQLTLTVQSSTPTPQEIPLAATPSHSAPSQLSLPMLALNTTLTMTRGVSTNGDETIDMQFKAALEEKSRQERASMSLAATIQQTDSDIATGTFELNLPLISWQNEINQLLSIYLPNRPATGAAHAPPTLESITGGLQLAGDLHVRWENPTYHVHLTEAELSSTEGLSAALTLPAAATQVHLRAESFDDVTVRNILSENPSINFSRGQSADALRLSAAMHATGASSKQSAWNTTISVDEISLANLLAPFDSTNPDTAAARDRLVFDGALQWQQLDLTLGSSVLSMLEANESQLPVDGEIDPRSNNLSNNLSLKTGTITIQNLASATEGKNTALFSQLVIDPMGPFMLQRNTHRDPRKDAAQVPASTQWSVPSNNWPLRVNGQVAGLTLPDVPQLSYPVSFAAAINPAMPNKKQSATSFDISALPTHWLTDFDAVLENSLPISGTAKVLLPDTTQSPGSLDPAPLRATYQAQDWPITHSWLQRFTRDVLPDAKLRTGTLSLQGTAMLQSSGLLSLQANASANEVSGTFLEYPLTGTRINTQLSLTANTQSKGESSDPLSAGLEVGPTHIESEQINIGFPLGPASVALSRFNVVAAGDSALLTTSLQADSSVLGGEAQLSCPEFDLATVSSQCDVAFNGVVLDQLVALEYQADLRLTGTVDGALQVDLDAGVISATGSAAAPEGGGNIRYRIDDAVLASADAPGLGFALRALEDFHYDTLRADIHFEPNGDLLLALQLKGYNPAVENGRAIDYNLNITENIPVLLQSLTVDKSISDQIQKRLETRK